MLASLAPMSHTAAEAVLVEIVRSSVVEGSHRGAVVALGADGTVDWSVGDVRRTFLPRSCNKPLQAVAMVELGLDLPDDLLALASASHSGEDFHVDGVRRILARGGIDESQLGNPADWPYEPRVRDEVLRAGGEPTRLLMNCSGKHAAMLTVCAQQGWPLEGYLAPDHPLQAAIESRFVELTGEPTRVAVDGCGAPLLATSLVGLARAYATLATASEGAPARVASAMRAHPEFVSGTTRDERRLLAAVPGMIGKSGAEACHVVALPDGRAWALKIDDGADRARPVALARALELSGLLGEPGVDAQAVRGLGEHPLLGAGAVVGGLRAAF